MENKLVKARLVQVFDRDDRLMAEEPVELSLGQLKQIVSAKNDDPQLLDGYVLSAEQLDKLQRLTHRKIDFNFTDFNFVLNCTIVYNPGEE